MLAKYAEYEKHHFSRGMVSEDDTGRKCYDLLVLKEDFPSKAHHRKKV